MMTNKERYKQAFSALHSSGEFHMEVEEMAQMQKKHRKNIAAAAAVACAIVIGGSGTVYAADIGGIQEKISMWYTTKTEIEVTENEDGGYTFTYDCNGKPAEIIGVGGVIIDENGNKPWLLEEELASHISESADIAEDRDGKVWLYYFDQKVEITGLFDEKGICRVLLSHEGKISYLKVTKNKDGSYSYSQTDDSTGEKETYLYIEIE